MAFLADEIGIGGANLQNWKTVFDISNATEKAAKVFEKTAGILQLFAQLSGEKNEFIAQKNFSQFRGNFGFGEVFLNFGILKKWGIFASAANIFENFQSADSQFLPAEFEFQNLVFAAKENFFSKELKIRSAVFGANNFENNFEI